MRTGRIAAITVGELPGPVVGTAAAVGFFGGAVESRDDDPGAPIVLDWSDVTGFGPGAVVAPSADALRSPSGNRERDLAGGSQDLFGRRLMTDGGTPSAPFADVEFDEADGRLIGFVVDDETIPLPRLVAVGPFAAIVEAAEAG